MAATETATYIGAPVPRREDRKLLTGQGSYVDNLTLPGMLWMALVRSPYAHARIVERRRRGRRRRAGRRRRVLRPRPRRGVGRRRSRAPGP